MSAFNGMSAQKSCERVLSEERIMGMRNALSCTARRVKYSADRALRARRVGR